MKEDESNPKIEKAQDALEQGEVLIDALREAEHVHFVLGPKLAAIATLAILQEVCAIFEEALEGEPEAKPAPKPQGVEFEHSAGPAMLLATDPTPKPQTIEFKAVAGDTPPKPTIKSLGGFVAGDVVEILIRNWKLQGDEWRPGVVLGFKSSGDGIDVRFDDEFGEPDNGFFTLEEVRKPAAPESEAPNV